MAKRGRDNIFSLFERQDSGKNARDLRVGFFGDGPFFSAMLKAYRSLDLKKDVIFFHTDPAIASKLAGENDIQHWTADPFEFTSKVDAVEIFDIPGKTDFVSNLLSSNVHVSLQKPFAYTNEEAMLLTRAARRSRGMLRVNEYPLFYEPYKKLKKLIDTMEIGEVCAIRFRCNLVGRGGIGPVPEMLDDENFLFHPAFDRFALAQYLLGEVESVCVYANSMKPRKGGQAIVGFKYRAPGCYGFLDLTYAPQTSIRTSCLPCDDQIEVAGTDGIIWANNFHGKMTEEPALDIRRGKKHYTMGIGSGMALEWESALVASAGHFLKCAARNRKPRPFLHDSRDALRFQIAAVQSADENKEIKL